jgi:hypothetical protein
VAIAAAGCTLIPFVHIVHAQVAAKFCITRRIRKSRHVSEPFIGCSQGFHWQLTGWIKALAFGTASSAIDSLISSQAHRPCLFPALVIDASKRLRAFGQFVSLSWTSPHEA